MKYFPLLILLLLSVPVYAEIPDSLRIGVVQSLTGIAAEDGKTVVQALELAAADIKQETGTSVELLIEDDQTTSKNAVTAFQKISASKPAAVIAATWDFTTNPLLPLIKQQRLVVFNTSTLPDSLDLKSTDGFAFVNAIRTADEAAPFRDFLGKVRSQTLAIVYANNSWGETQRRVYGDIARASGLQIVEEIKPATYDENEWRDLLPRIKQKKADVVLLLLNKNDLKVFLRRAQEVSLQGRFFASKNAFDAFHSESSKNMFEKLCFTYPLARVQREREFSDRYKARYGEQPRIYADNSYDALFIIEKAWRLSRERNVSLKDAMPAVVHSGVVGHYEYDANRSFSLGDSSLVCVAEGKLDIIDPAENKRLDGRATRE